MESTDSQKLDELHACQTLLAIMSNMLGSMNLESLRNLVEEVQKVDAFEREKGILRTDECNDWELKHSKIARCKNRKSSIL